MMVKEVPTGSGGGAMNCSFTESETIAVKAALLVYTAKLRGKKRKNTPANAALISGAGEAGCLLAASSPPEPVPFRGGARISTTLAVDELLVEVKIRMDRRTGDNAVMEAALQILYSVLLRAKSELYATTPDDLLEALGLERIEGDGGTVTRKVVG